ncbi:hypothetical protein TNCV_3950961 [Trichonephila clavipes]|nr:hypothetical protein TNCV_3950961 [Trichonephila clavipes]
MVKETRLIQTNHYLTMVRTGILRKKSGELRQDDEGSRRPDDRNSKDQGIEDCTKQLETKLANTHLTATVTGGNPPSTSKKNNRQDGFVTPAKVAKKQKVLQNYTFGAATPVNTTNKFQALTGSDASPTSDATAVPVAPPPKIPPST